MAGNFSYLPEPLQAELRKIASALATPGKGILAADEQAPNLGRRLAEIRLENTEENRRRYRQLLFTTDKKIGNYLSGVIFLPEFLHQKADDGTPFVELLKQRGIITGINVDKGFVRLEGSKDEVTTQGLDNLNQRCAQFKKDGCGFTKFQVVYKITRDTPSLLAIKENANTLAKYASIAQKNGLVPIVEPDINSDGDHTLEQAQKVTEVVLAAVYKALEDHHVFLEGTLLKPSMVIPGRSYPVKYTAKDIGEATVLALSRTVPTAVPGVGFLSGGLPDDVSTAYLNAVNQYPGKKPWNLSFTFGRALQASVHKIWAGKDENVVKAQQELLKQAENNSLASLGKYVA